MHSPLTTLLAAAALAAALAGCARKDEKPSPSGSAGAHGEQEAFGQLSVEQLQAKIDEARAGKLTLAIIDNNGKERFEQSHIPGAKWVDFKNVQQSDLPADRSATLVFYCANEH